MLTRSESVRDFEPVFHTNLDSLIELPAVMRIHALTCSLQFQDVGYGNHDQQKRGKVRTS